MLYQFYSDDFGRCVLNQRTTGKHGFCSPKIFTIQSLDNPALGNWTFRFVDNLIAGAVPSATIPNPTLCRIAIAQFLSASRSNVRDPVVSLDISLAAFEGAVFNEEGVVLTYRRLHSPRRGAS